MALSSEKGSVSRSVQLTAHRSAYSTGKVGLGDFNILEKITGGTGSSDKPIVVRISHELTPLHEPVVKVSLIIIAGTLLLLLVNSARK